MGHIVSRCCPVAENDDRFWKVDFGKKKRMEVMFSVSDRCLEVHLIQRCGYGKLLSIDFADENRWLSRCSRPFLQCPNFRSDCCGEEEGLSLRGRGQD